MIVLDADLQDPPEVVLELASRWREGYDVVYAVRDVRQGETRFKRATAAAFYRAFNRISEVQGAPVDVGDFRLVDRRALDVFAQMRESNRFVRGMFSWIGLRQTGVVYKRQERFAGETKYPLRKMLRFAATGVISFSGAPLRVALNLGFIVSFVAFGLGIWSLIVKLCGSLRVPGWTSIVVVTTFHRRHPADRARRDRRVRRRHPRRGEAAAALRDRRARELPGATGAPPAGRGGSHPASPGVPELVANTMRQFSRFLVVGVGNTLISFGVYALLLRVGAPYLVAAPIAFAAGAVNGYVFNRTWTFHARDSTQARVLYVIVQAIGAVSTSLLTLLFVQAGASEVVAFLATVPLVTVSMFVANRRWTFADVSS